MCRYDWFRQRNDEMPSPSLARLFVAVFTTFGTAERIVWIRLAASTEAAKPTTTKSITAGINMYFRIESPFWVECDCLGTHPSGGQYTDRQDYQESLQNVPADFAGSRPSDTPRNIATDAGNASDGNAATEQNDADKQRHHRQQYDFSHKYPLSVKGCQTHRPECSHIPQFQLGR